jgi:Domain of unknown function (DUF397)
MLAYTRWRKSSFSEGAGTDCVEVAWRKSSFSEGGGTDCVEVALAQGRAALRDSKNVDGPILTVPASMWRGFVAVVSQSPPGGGGAGA